MMSFTKHSKMHQFLNILYLVHTSAYTHECDAILGGRHNQGGASLGQVSGAVGHSHLHQLLELEVLKPTARTIGLFVSSGFWFKIQALIN